MLASVPMLAKLSVLCLSLCAAVSVRAADNGELQERRHLAAVAFHDGILLVHAKSALDFTADGFRQDPAFYYSTGLENISGALLAIDGRSGEKLALHAFPSPFSNLLPPELSRESRSSQTITAEED